jgi:hypothetical protein
MAKAFYSTGVCHACGKRWENCAKKLKKNEKKIDFVAESQQPHIIMLSLRHQIVDEMSGLFEPFLIYIA